MKKHVYTMIALIVMVGSLAVAAQAQGGSGSRLVASIPFDFSVDGKTLPAGEYTVRQINPSSDRVILQLRSKDGHGAMIQMNNVIGRANDGARLVFNRYGNQYYFSQAWMAAEATGLRATPNRAEHSEREIAGSRSKSETVALRVR